MGNVDVVRDRGTGVGGGAEDEVSTAMVSPISDYGQQ
jgi:hypothetical protein